MFYRDLWSWLKTKNYFNFNFFLIWVVESSMIHVQLLRAWSTSCSLEMRRPCPASRTWTYSLSYIVWLTRWWSYFQCCGSGFRIQMESATLWIRINIPNMDPDPLQLSSGIGKSRGKRFQKFLCIPFLVKNKKDFKKDFSGLKKIFQKMNCLKFVFKLDYVRYPVTVLNTISDLSNPDQNLGKIQDPFSVTIYNLAALWIQNTGCFCYY